jgi:hypothetical protein
MSKFQQWKIFTTNISRLGFRFTLENLIALDNSFCYTILGLKRFHN